MGNVQRLQPTSPAPSPSPSTAEKSWRALRELALTYRTGERLTIPRLSMLGEARAHVEAINRAATPQELVAQLAILSEWARAFNIPHDAEAVVGGYAGIAHLPPDLLAQAIKATTTTHKFGNRMPLPAEILQHVQENLDERRQAKLKLGLLQRGARIGLVTEARPTPYRKLPPEEKARVDRIIEESLAKIGRKPPGGRNEE